MHIHYLTQMQPIINSNSKCSTSCHLVRCVVILCILDVEEVVQLHCNTCPFGVHS